MNTKMKKYMIWMLACGLAMASTACQKAVIEENETSTVVENGVAVQFNVGKLEQIPFGNTMAARATDIRTACTRLSLAVYQNGKKTSQINQLATDADYGKVRLVLTPGTYRIAVIAHSGEKNPTMTDAERITFDGKVTDTFYYCDEFTVQGNATHDLTLRRAVAMFRLIVEDSIPEKVTTMRFYYTGGSSTFDAVHGVGCVNSKQSESRTVATTMRAPGSTYEVYTFPRADSQSLKMQVTAHDAASNVVMEQTFAGVGISRNMITQYSGTLFGGASGITPLQGDTIQLSLYSVDEWQVVNHTF